MAWPRFSTQKGLEDALVGWFTLQRLMLLPLALRLQWMLEVDLEMQGGFLRGLL